MSFWGYPRPDGSIGTRNYVAIIPTVVCATATARQVSDNVKGSVPFLHHQGCALTPDDLAMANRTLMNLALNPNIAAVVLISLGCDPMDIDGIAEGIAREGKPVEKLVIQQVGGTIATVEKGTKIARQMVSDASRVLRAEFDDAQLMFGAECGGSDTTSGLGGNPAIGAAFDILVKKGGRAVFSETTEFIGAEHLLARRAVTPEVGAQITAMVRRYEERFLERGVDMRGTNPTKGNIEGGLTTIEEKSLGAISKGGTETIQEIYEYGERPSKGGLTIVDGPGFDAPSLTAMAAAGATVMFFSTGRGTPLGSPFVPVVKVTANGATFEKMKDNIDFYVNLAQKDHMGEIGADLYAEALQVASGKQTKAEILGQDRDNGLFIVGPLA
ncbi:MAG: galactonate dehydratase [Dehalococcoidia bacterium]|nr:MAG: galactonate dehydratase [Dehalococcoidia bacterium]